MWILPIMDTEENLLKAWPLEYQGYPAQICTNPLDPYPSMLVRLSDRIVEVCKVNGWVTRTVAFTHRPRRRLKRQVKIYTNVLDRIQSSPAPGTLKIHPYESVVQTSAPPLDQPLP